MLYRQTRLRDALHVIHEATRSDSEDESFTGLKRKSSSFIGPEIIKRQRQYTSHIIAKSNSDPISPSPSPSALASTPVPIDTFITLKLNTKIFLNGLANEQGTGHTAQGSTARPTNETSLSRLDQDSLQRSLPGSAENPILLEDLPSLETLPGEREIISLSSSPEPSSGPPPGPPPGPREEAGLEITGFRRILHIRTYWAHPIDFKCIPSKNEACHFCTDPKYGMFGYGISDTAVLRRTGAVYEEVGNGHRARGREATRINGVPYRADLEFLFMGSLLHQSYGL
ncbi:hypothetical protein B0A52_00180 [Exophiala mesophila]|uniref:Uncharacterized protein n=1 Tax=Exophiala mesophila TaxID=212818 RepID=A0A438NJB7_EXOME|nr:hypothetical protein B0A52_00180 [Exophiala mesophila]